MNDVRKSTILALSLEAGDTEGVDFTAEKRNAIFADLRTRLRGCSLIPDIYVVLKTDRTREIPGTTGLSVTSEGNVINGGSSYRPPTDNSPAIIEVYLEAEEGRINNDQRSGLVTLVKEALGLP